MAIQGVNPNVVSHAKTAVAEAKLPQLPAQKAEVAKNDAPVPEIKKPEVGKVGTDGNKTLAIA